MRQSTVAAPSAQATAAFLPPGTLGSARSATSTGARSARTHAARDAVASGNPQTMPVPSVGAPPTTRRAGRQSCTTPPPFPAGIVARNGNPPRSVARPARRSTSSPPTLTFPLSTMIPAWRSSSPSRGRSRARRAGPCCGEMPWRGSASTVSVTEQSFSPGSGSSARLVISALASSRS